MSTKKPLTKDEADRSLDQFLEAQDDVSTVHNVEQNLELHIVETEAYVNSYLRQVMDEAHGAPVMAVITRTNREAKKVFFYAADNPNSPNARKLRAVDQLGPAYFAFGVPLRQLRIKLPEKYRLVLPVGTLTGPDDKMIFWVSFADYEKERRKLGATGTASTQGEKKSRKKKEQSAPTTP